MYVQRTYVHSRPQGGVVELDGETPLQLGVTKWRTLVTYVPQTRVHPKGTPSEFYFTVQVLAEPVSCTSTVSARAASTFATVIIESCKARGWLAHARTTSRWLLHIMQPHIERLSWLEVQPASDALRLGIPGNWRSNSRRRRGARGAICRPSPARWASTLRSSSTSPGRSSRCAPPGVKP